VATAPGVGEDGSVGHMAETTLWYATDLAAGEGRLDTMELRVSPETPQADLVRTVGAFATVLARVVDGAPPGARGWHPFGLADASGFAAMGCDELAERRSGIDAAFT
jgi:hypothetical protein